jgi:hypothetical protein
MFERLPSIDIRVNQQPQDAVRAFAEVARSLGTFNVEVTQAFTGEEGTDIANLRCLNSSPHKDLGIQFISLKEQKGRVSVEVRASRWAPDDPPTYEAYCDAAKRLAKPILKEYNATHNTSYRLRIPTRKSMMPKLPPASARTFDRFVALANRTGLHPLDWRRFYQFVWLSRARSLSEDDMALLLTASGFSREYAVEIASVYLHLCEFKALR